MVTELMDSGRDDPPSSDYGGQVDDGRRALPKKRANFGWLRLGRDGFRWLPPPLRYGATSRRGEEGGCYQWLPIPTNGYGTILGVLALLAVLRRYGTSKIF